MYMFNSLMNVVEYRMIYVKHVKWRIRVLSRCLNRTSLLVSIFSCFCIGRKLQEVLSIACSVSNMLHVHDWFRLV